MEMLTTREYFLQKLAAYGLSTTHIYLSNKKPASSDNEERSAYVVFDEILLVSSYVFFSNADLW